MRGRFGTDVFTDYAMDFVERHRDRPFFLYYPMALTHDPFLPTPRSRDFREEQKHRGDKVWFADMVAYMDEAAGRIVRKIDGAGLAGNTLVLFTGDNGASPAITTRTANGPYRGGKGSTIAAGTHVPLIARWQGAPGQRAVCSDLVDFTDFFPTLAEAAGAHIPDDHPRDGRSFLPPITGRKGSPREWIFCDYNPRWGRFQPARWAMDERWKLYGDGRFYDLQNDPREQQPLTALTPEMRQASAKLASALSAMKT
jgi:arylsulfatase A